MIFMTLLRANNEAIDPSLMWVSIRSPLLALAWVMIATALPTAYGQEPSDKEPNTAASQLKAIYSPEVVEKADRILADAGLKRSGKGIISTLPADASRALSGLAKTRRSLKLVHDAWKATANQLSQLRQQAELINVQNIQINTQLAQPALSVSEHNRLVAMNNANVAKLRQLMADEERVKAQLAIDRKALTDAEEAYANQVLAIRKDVNAIHDRLTKSLENDQVRVALRVSHANFETPAELTADMLLAVLEKRLRQVEQDVFSESIALDVTENGSMYVNVFVGDKSIRMVVDSGANVISLPSRAAAELGVNIPADAPKLRLELADGSSIPGRLVKLAKVRVGQFEAENVEAAILDEVAVNAEPLLGMSYLGNFKFEIDSNDKSLTLLRVATD